MKTFIAVAKQYREKYKESMPFIWAMCKPVMREDVKNIITRLQ